MSKIITEKQLKTRADWISKINTNNDNFTQRFSELESSLQNEIKKEGLSTLLSHIRLCGAIPEHYGHDSSEEKLYSKYTDAVLAQTFSYLNVDSQVLEERSDAADVLCKSKNYSFVADAKAFRLSRTAKNQKDFKVESMARWKNNCDYAIIVCPIYQLPTKSSQIYQQAIDSEVCIFTYTHLAVLANYANITSKTKAQSLIHDIFKQISIINPSKNASTYWNEINNCILNSDSKIRRFWKEEKIANSESIRYAKQEALDALQKERLRIMSMKKMN